MIVTMEITKLKKSSVVAIRLVLLIIFVALFPMIFLLVWATMDMPDTKGRGFWEIIRDAYWALLTGKGFEDVNE